MGSAKYDVVIIGSGPAGSTAAIECANEGLKVAMIEKLRHPRMKVCGGGVVKRAHDLFPVNIDSAVEKVVSDIELAWHKSNFSFVGHCDTPAIYMVMRQQLDKLLVEEAVKKGVEFFQDTELSAIDARDDKVILKSKNDMWVADWVIAADGTGGNTAKLAGWEKDTRTAIPALEAEVKLRPEAAAKLQTTRIDFEVIKYGYGWVFPKTNNLSIGVGRFQIVTAKLPPLKEIGRAHV